LVTPVVLALWSKMIMSETMVLLLQQVFLIGVVLTLNTYLGLHIIRRNLIFCDLVLDQLAVLGILVGVSLHIQYGSPLSCVLALVGSVFGSILLALVQPRSREIPREAVIGILYAMALVISLMWTDKLPGGDVYLEKSLSGYMEWASWPLVMLTTIIYIGLGLFHYRFRREFIALTESPQILRSQRLWDFLFFTTEGVITTITVPVTGVLLDYAFLMIPAAIATMFTPSWGPAMILGWSIGLVACCLGLGSSFVFGLSYGPSLVLSLGVFFTAALILRSLRNKKG